jgi:hypothetical protein
MPSEVVLMQEYLEWSYLHGDNSERTEVVGNKDGNLYKSTFFYLFANSWSEGLLEYEWDFYIRNEINTAVCIGHVSTINWRSTLLNLMRRIL